MLNTLSNFLLPEHALVSRRALKLVAALTVVVVLGAGTAVSFTDPDHFESVWEGFWWACSTVTTVGYGDYAPRSTIGRVIAVGLMFVGIALVSILTASIASALLAVDVGDEERHIDDELSRILEALTRLEQRLDRIQGDGVSGR